MWVYRRKGQGLRTENFGRQTDNSSSGYVLVLHNRLWPSVTLLGSLRTAYKRSATRRHTAVDESFVSAFNCVMEALCYVQIFERISHACIYRAGICVPATDGLVHAKYASIEPLWFMQYTLKEEISDCKSTTNNICN